jgi:ribosomal protein S18 acetylase RimI-like enzyme
MEHYRIASSADTRTVAHLHALSWQNSYRGIFTDDYLDNQVVEDRIQVWTKRLDNPPNHQIVILKEIDGHVVGFVCAFGSSTDEFGTFIDNLHVLPAFKGKGIGRDLMRQVYDWSLLHFNQPRLSLEVLEENHSARFFYEKVGGICQDTFPETLPSGNVASVCRYVWNKYEF